MSRPTLMLETPLRERSLNCAFMSVMCWAVMFGIGESSFALFAAHLQFPTWFFGWLIGLPALLGPLMQVCGANLLERSRNRRAMCLTSVLLQCALFLPLAVLPLLPPSQATYAVFCAMLIGYYVLANFPSPAWNSWISVLVPSDQRADYFARISRGVGAISLVTKLSVGAALFCAGTQLAEVGRQHMGLIFALAFAIAGGVRFLSFWFMRGMHEPKYEITPDACFTFWQFVRRARESNFVHFVFYVSLVMLGTFISAPFFVPYAIYTLKFAQWQWVAIDSMAALAAVLTLLYWSQFTKRFGNKVAIKYSSYWIALIPLCWILTENFYWLLAITATSGAAWAGFNLSTFNYILEAVSPPKRARCVAYFAIFAGVGMFLGSMLGGCVDKYVPCMDLGPFPAPKSSFMYLLVLSGIVRVVAGLIFLPTFRELSEVQPFSLKEVFYIAQLRFPVGLRFETIFSSHAQNEQAEPSPQTVQQPAEQTEVLQK